MKLGATETQAKHMNIKSINEHLDELQVFLQTFDRKLIAICLSETQLKNCAKKARHFRDYHKPNTQAFVNKASGVSVYVGKDFRCPPINICTRIENVTVMITGKRTNKFILCCIYNSYILLFQRTFYCKTSINYWQSWIINLYQYMLLVI